MTAFLAGGHQFKVTGIGYKEHHRILLWEPREDGSGEDLYAVHYSHVQIGFQIVSSAVPQQAVPSILRGGIAQA